MVRGDQEKLCFFTFNCNPSLAYIAVRDLQSSQRKASEQSLLLAGNVLYNQWQPSTGEGELANFREFLAKKTQYLMNTLYLMRFQALSLGNRWQEWPEWLSLLLTLKCLDNHY